MATTVIGSRGLINADLVLVQDVSFRCTFVHERADGTAIDHEGWSAWCRIKGGSTDIDLTDRVTFGADGEIQLSIPDDVTKDIPSGTYLWDLIVEDGTGYSTRIAYGSCNVAPSLARG